MVEIIGCFLKTQQLLQASKIIYYCVYIKNDHMFLIADLFQENYSVLGFVFLFIQWVGDGGENNKSV